MSQASPIQYDAQPGGYQPGVCNIGPAEIDRRRRAGHIGVVATIVLFAVLVALDLPPIVRLVLALPAAVAASGYLQARMRFCAGFATAGVYNFGDVGPREQVTDRAALAARPPEGLSDLPRELGHRAGRGVVAVLLAASEHSLGESVWGRMSPYRSPLGGYARRPRGGAATRPPIGR